MAIQDEGARRELRLPAYMLAKLLPNIGRDPIRLLSRVQEMWAPDFGSLTVWLPSPSGSLAWLNPATANALARDLPESVSLRPTFREHNEGLAEIHAGTPSLENLRRCVELGLHTWRGRPHSQRICASCSASHERIHRDGSKAAPLIQRVVSTHLWKLGNERYFGRFQGNRDISATALPLQLLVDTSSLQERGGNESPSFTYLVAANGRGGLRLVTLPGKAQLWPGIRPLALGQNTDVNKTLQHHVILANLHENRNLGTTQELEDLASECGGGDDGHRRAFLLSVARETCHGMITMDEVLLARKPNHREAPLLDPREAAVLAGIRLRYADSIPIPTTHGEILYSIRSQHFNQVRPVALLPELADRLGALIAGSKRGLWADRCIRLFSGCLARLTLLCEAEDRLAFLWHFPQEHSSADDDSAYHLEFFLMLAQALLDSLKALAGERHGFSEQKVIGWRLFLERVKIVNEPLHQFLTSLSGAAVRRVVHELRRPLAHAEHWLGTTHAGGSEDPTLVSLQVAGTPAVKVPRSVVSLREEPETWGISAWSYDIEDPQVQLQGYPFALNLNARLLWFVREFLARLQLETDLTEREISRHRPLPTQLTNPDVNEAAHAVVRILSLPLPA